MKKRCRFVLLMFIVFTVLLSACGSAVVKVEAPAAEAAEDADHSEAEPEPTFISDYSDGSANTQSQISAPYFISDARFYPMVRQDQTLYWCYFEEMLKEPFGASVSDAELITDSVWSQTEDYEYLQIIGDYLYFAVTYERYMSLYRIRTDGECFEELLSDVARPMSKSGFYSSDRMNMCIIDNRDGNMYLYYCSTEEHRTDASTVSYISRFLRCKLTESNGYANVTDAEVISEMVTDDYWKAMGICGYSNGVFLLNSYGYDGLYVYHVGDESVSEAPSWLENGFYIFTDPVTGEFAVYGDGINLWWVSPEDLGSPRTVTTNAGSLAGNENLGKRRPDRIAVYDGKIYFAGLNTLGYYDESNTYVTINNDGHYTHSVCVPGDGYVYYEVIMSNDHNIYRVRTDGTGWEELHF